MEEGAVLAEQASNVLPNILKGQQDYGSISERSSCSTSDELNAGEKVQPTDTIIVEKETVIIKVREETIANKEHLQEVHWANPESSHVAILPSTPTRQKSGFPNKTPPRPPKSSPFHTTFSATPRTPQRTVHNPYKMMTPSPHPASPYNKNPFYRYSPNKQQRTPTRTREAVRQLNGMSLFNRNGSPGELSQSLLSPHSENISSLETTPGSLQTTTLSPGFPLASDSVFVPPAAAFSPNPSISSVSAQLAAQLLQCAPDLPPSLQPAAQFTANSLSAYTNFFSENRNALAQLQMLYPALAAATSASYYQDPNAQARLAGYSGLDSLQIQVPSVPLLSGLVSPSAPAPPSPSAASTQQNAQQQQVASKIFVLVEFKRGRTVQFQSSFFPRQGDYILCDGDNGEDIGQVVHTWIAPANSTPVVNNSLAANRNSNGDEVDPSTGCHVYPRVLRLANAKEVSYRMTSQAQAEAKCVDVARTKVTEHGLDMQIIDAEYQYDRKKLTFYYDAGERVDFRELVRDLYKIYRARIWMSKTRFQDEPREAAPEK